MLLLIGINFLLCPHILHASGNENRRVWEHTQRSDRYIRKNQLDRSRHLVAGLTALGFNVEIIPIAKQSFAIYQDNGAVSPIGLG